MPSTSLGASGTSPMADSILLSVEALAARELGVLRRARARMSVVDNDAGPGHVRWRVVQDAADHLARVARDATCPDALGVVLLDWRDRLSSHILAARALAELDVHRDLAEQLLCRGLDEITQEAPLRLVALRAKLAPSAASGR